MELANGHGGVVEIGDIAAYMRARNHPMDAWQIRGELSTLKAMGLVEIDQGDGRLAAGVRPGFRIRTGGRLGACAVEVSRSETSNATDRSR